MAITGTNRGSGGNITSETSWSFSPTSDLSQYSTAVLCVAYDNSGTSGVDAITGITDSKGNSWIRMNKIVRGGGGTNLGVVSRQLISYQENGTLTTSDTITITFNTSTTAKKYTLQDFTTDVSNGYVGEIYRSTRFAGTGTSSSPGPFIISGITSGDVIIAMVGCETNDSTITTDSDTLEGSWSTAQIAAGTGMSICSQYKITTGSSNQSYELSGFGTGQDYAFSAITLREFSERFVVIPLAAGQDDTVVTGDAYGGTFTDDYVFQIASKDHLSQGKCAVGQMVAIVLSLYKSGTTDLSSIGCTASDSAGNTWTVDKQGSGVSSNLYANILIYSVITNEIAEGATITLTITGTPTYYKAICYKIASLRGKAIAATWSNYNTGASTQTINVTGIVPAAAGNSIITSMAITAAIPTISNDDSDTTDGIWSWLIGDYSDNNFIQMSQFKSVSGTTSQSWNLSTSNNLTYRGDAWYFYVPDYGIHVDPFGQFGFFGL